MSGGGPASHRPAVCRMLQFPVTASAQAPPPDAPSPDSIPYCSLGRQVTTKKHGTGYMFESWTREDSNSVKAFFGCPARVLVAAWVLRRGNEPFYQEEATTALKDAGESASATQAALRLFVANGLLSEFRDRNRLYYTRLDHPLWPAFSTIAAAVGLNPKAADPAWSPTRAHPGSRPRPGSARFPSPT